VVAEVDRVAREEGSGEVKSIRRRYIDSVDDFDDLGR
jgi:hypothetical protein